MGKQAEFTHPMMVLSEPTFSVPVTSPLPKNAREMASDSPAGVPLFDELGSVSIALEESWKRKKGS